MLDTVPNEENIDESDQDTLPQSRSSPKSFQCSNLRAVPQKNLQTGSFARKAIKDLIAIDEDENIEFQSYDYSQYFMREKSEIQRSLQREILREKIQLLIEFTQKYVNNENSLQRIQTLKQRCLESNHAQKFQDYEQLNDVETKVTEELESLQQIVIH